MHKPALYLAAPFCLFIVQMSAHAQSGSLTQDFSAQNLTLSSNLDVNGNYFTFGTSNTPQNFGLQLSYQEHIGNPTSPSQIEFTANQLQTQWVFDRLAAPGSATRVPMLKIDAQNILELYATWNSTTPRIRLDPQSGMISIDGNQVVTANQIFSGGGGGYSSTQLGYGAYAHSSYAVALGSANAMGYNSTALGEGASANSDYAVALGSASAYGYYSTALGYGAYTSSDYAVALGSASAGYYSTALGNGASANGDHAVALGAAGANGYNSTALGEGASANSDYAVALGSASANGYNSTALGYGADTGNDGAVALGSASANGYNSTALGYGANTGNDGAVALGAWASANGYNSTALGYVASANSAYAVALGYNLSANGNYSVAIGRQTTAQADGQTVMGQFNVLQGTPGQSLPADNIFIIGNGTGTSTAARSNAFAVKRNGDTDVSGKATIKGGLTIPGVPESASPTATIIATSNRLLLIPQQGDLSMGSFTAGAKPQ